MRMNKDSAGIAKHVVETTLDVGDTPIALTRMRKARRGT